ncbi:hypothetical protein L873DRAFT_1080311 [Choiromyces venosus 120613-1]|uniref:Copper transporter n=1 Tax=Choiromyces venosus 120613-1 TaxID=1336337 RepID=A0A3N4JLS1_9PEZI|nr:hypothetical protein L873DRAFT_1080311 [Choiromyces venosus 120613-1]
MRHAHFSFLLFLFFSFLSLLLFRCCVSKVEGKTVEEHKEERMRHLARMEGRCKEDKPRKRDMLRSLSPAGREPTSTDWFQRSKLLSWREGIDSEDAALGRGTFAPLNSIELFFFYFFFIYPTNVNPVPTGPMPTPAHTAAIIVPYGMIRFFFFQWLCGPAAFAARHLILQLFSLLFFPFLGPFPLLPHTLPLPVPPSLAQSSLLPLIDFTLPPSPK